MPYDPTKPADGSLADAAELRSQFAAQQASIDGKATAIPQIAPLSYAPDVQPQDPMTADLVAKVNEMIAALKA